MDLRKRIAELGKSEAERKRAEEALKVSETRYRRIFETAKDGILLLDAGTGQITDVNPYLIEMLGYTHEEFMGKKLWEIGIFKDIAKSKGAFQELQKKEYIRYEHLPFETKDGKHIDVEFVSNVYLVDHKKVIQCNIRDITERKQAEEAVRETEKRFRELYDNAPVGYHEYDAEGRITNVNCTDLEMLGYTREEMIGQPMWKFNVGEDIVREQTLAKLAGTMPPGRGLERTYQRKDGATLSVLIEDRLILDEKGQITGIRCTIQDITERKQAEESLRTSQERFRQLFDGAPIGYHEIDREGRFTRVNRTESEMLGYTVEEMLGQPAWNFIVEEEESRKAVTAKLAGVVLPFKGLEPTYRRKDGTTFPVIIEDLLLRDSEGRIIGIRSTIQDITDRKRAEQEMVALQEQLRQSQKMEAIGRLAGGIAHDFNNLLTIIKGYSQLSLLELKEDSPLKGNIEEINRATDRSVDLIRQLLAFSRCQILEMNVLDLNTVLRNLEKMLRRVIGEDIELVTLLAEDLGRVKTDPGWIEQVIMNLVVNARDAMPNGGKLTIETANVELDKAYAREHVAVTPGRYVMLAVSDTGLGMTPEVRDRVFEPFFTTKEKSKGTGLGLSTVYGIVKQSDGNVWVYSEPGHGTVFKIYLPRVEEPLGKVKERKVGEEPPCGSETVLVVEDEQEVRKLAVRILSEQGYKILEASQGVDAFLICAEHKGSIHLLVTDVVMPKMSGCELAERISLIRPEIKVLYMSGYTDNTIVHHGVLEEGMNYIQKPFTVGALAGKVREVLDNKEG